jgi:uncharacterized peroxidase-related enzyme
MSLIDMVQPEEATGEAGRIYAEIQQAFGNVPNVLKVWSASPFLLKQQWEFISYSLNHPKLSPALLACIRLMVSRGNHCDYCVDMNKGMLINLFGWTPDQVEYMIDNPAEANLPHMEKAMLGLVLKAVHHSNQVTANDVAHVRDQGYSDQDVLDAVAHGARMTAGDIVINAFRVEKDF